MTMEIIDFNPYTIQRRLSAQTGAKKELESVSSLSFGHLQTLAKDQEHGETTNGFAIDLGDRKVYLKDKSSGTPDPEREELESRSRIATVTPLQVPDWIPLEAAARCNLPYTSYEIPIPSDLNMDFCIDVMMGQDTIVFMFVRGDRFVLVLVKTNLGGDTG